MCNLYEMIQNAKQKEFRFEFLLIELAHIGVFSFLMLWESGPRYFSNFVPLTILGATVGIGNLKKIKADEETAEYWKQKGISVLQKIKETPVFVFTRKQWKRRSVRIFSYSVIFRMIIYLFSVCVMAMFGDYQEGITLSDFLETWKRWDSAHYLNIAENGYMGAVENGQHLFLVFYPLYPWLIKTLYFLVGDYRLAGIIISVVCYGIGNVYLDKLMCKEYSGEAARKAVCYLAIYPFSFFFGAILTESLYFALLTLFLYHLRKHKWWEVAFFGFLICMTKVQGLLLTLSVIAELFYSYHGIRLLKEHKWKKFWQKIICNGLRCVPMVGGIVVYLMINYHVEGDPFRFMYYQKEHWGNSLCPIWHTISYLKYYGTQEWTTSFGMSQWLPEYLLLFVYVAAIIYGIRKKMRPTYLVYLISFFTLTYSSTWLISAARYSLSALPIFMLAGKFLEDHKKWTKPVLAVAYGFMMIYMIGFYQWKSIM